MRVPVVRGVIERRLLVNYRVDPAALRPVLPTPFRPQLVGGAAIAGICLIRLSGIRPPYVPAGLGVSSENAAHRIAVQWDEGGTTREGVYIPRRDSSSRLNRLLGGRLFPGVHHAARFDVRERGGEFRVRMDSADGVTHVLVEGTLAPALPAGSAFDSLAAASAFFERGALGYSATARAGVFDGLELRSLAWKVEPLAVTAVESSFFEDRRHFAPGSAEFDCALVMRNIAHEWHARDQLCLESAEPAA
ncbi:MAG: DUF2071 domain-containing protein [Gemmatimonadaceae bacterium]